MMTVSGRPEKRAGKVRLYSRLAFPLTFEQHFALHNLR
nr:C771 [uncultured bacterium]ART37724.1 E196 [uncultured bacterium]ART38104.1 F172 [uncultured bacterium]ART38610.1 G196 [uncultured bacterium]ART38983.1 H327 [uncultured bacterium]